MSLNPWKEVSSEALIESWRSRWLCLMLAVTAGAQNRSARRSLRADSPPVARPSRPPLVPLEIQVVIARYQGEKRISSMPYVMAVNANGERASLNMGAEVAIPSTARSRRPADGKPSSPVGLHSYNYRSIGTNIVCGAMSADEGPLRREHFASTIVRCS